MKAIALQIYYIGSSLHQKLFVAEDPDTRWWQLSGVQLLAGVGFALLFGVLLFWYGLLYDREMPGKYFDAHRNYKLMPFDILDATRICSQKTKAKYGELYVRSYVDEHSTRFEPAAGVYKIFLRAYIGNNRIADEANVHCFVDPGRYMVSHYRTYETKRRSLMKRAIDLLGG